MNGLRLELDFGRGGFCRRNGRLYLYGIRFSGRHNYQREQSASDKNSRQTAAPETLFFSSKQFHQFLIHLSDLR